MITTVSFPVFIIHAQELQTNQQSPVIQTPSTQSTQISPPELPPTPRSKLEIIQYVLLPFAIGASIWLILRLEKMERKETKENKEE